MEENTKGSVESTGIKDGRSGRVTRRAEHRDSDSDSDLWAGIQAGHGQGEFSLQRPEERAVVPSSGEALGPWQGEDDAGRVCAERSSIPRLG